MEENTLTGRYSLTGWVSRSLWDSDTFIQWDTGKNYSLQDLSAHLKVLWLTVTG